MDVRVCLDQAERPSERPERRRLACLAPLLFHDFSVGLEWDVSGDDNHDATAALEYRKTGTSTWQPALPLVRVDYNGRNTLAGSALFLAADTSYDLRIALTDPDGGSQTRQVT